MALLVSGCGGGGGGGAGAPADRDCSDFATQEDAQAFFDRNGGSPSNNVSGLDNDGDGIACEGLPRRAPTSLKATPANRKVLLEWEPSGEATSYDVEWFVSSAPAGSQVSPRNGVIKDVTSPLEVGGLTNEVTYEFRIIGLISGGSIGSTDFVSAIPRSDFHLLSMDRGSADALRVTSDPPGIDCRPACSASFPHGTEVTLTVTPMDGWKFIGWGLACGANQSVTDPRCTLTLNSDVTVKTNWTR